MTPHAYERTPAAKIRPSLCPITVTETKNVVNDVNLELESGLSHTDINVPHRVLDPDTVTHLSTNRA